MAEGARDRGEIEVDDDEVKHCEGPFRTCGRDDRVRNDTFTIPRLSPSRRAMHITGRVGANPRDRLG